VITDQICEGCGAPLQSEHPEAPGYVPAHVARRGEPVVCRRCFRINNYGKEEKVKTDSENAWATVMDVVRSVGCCIMVVDVLDFEGSFIPDLADLARGKLILAANKVDLLPAKTPVEEVGRWIDARLASLGLKAEGIYPISARSGYGVRVLLDAARKLSGKGGHVGLVGATNVGKSTLVNRWLKGTEAEGPTVSRFPGTTLGVVTREVSTAGLVVLDTPGLISRGRVTDILCHDCATHFVPEAPLASKLIRLAPGHSVVFGGLAAFTPLGEPEEEHLLLAFAAGEVPIQKVRTERFTLRTASLEPGRSQLLCPQCQESLSRTGWEEVVTDVGEMEDVCVHGLGWISPRRKGMKVRVTLPAGALATVRPRLVGPKTPGAAKRSGS